ncbi:alpha/beta hydrolase fold protein [Deinococcus aerius]|uniref:Alpha/beta hydrolase fold protein n=1 Tax=Deinococcus aerius TaxID=200253 RepID=A0A2I9CTJ7_9DEIO|nr:alpha/beta fold hydrolase [Deinococcus aerius]GBF05103.1 alpha/beta hydrolase fold protein [Deinococcus aerius]
MKISVHGTSLHLSQCGDGPPLLLLNGGGGCPNYLAPVAELLPGFRCLLPDPRGTGRSTGGVYGLTTALSDLEAIREALGLDRWAVLGHSWGADLGLAYTLAHPERVTRLVSWAGTGVQNDRDWHAAYEAGKDSEPRFEVDWNAAIHRALLDDWRRFIKAPDLLARLSRLEVPVTFLHMGADIRPGWPAGQLAALLPKGEWRELPGAPHNAWFTHVPQLGEALRAALRR